MIFKGLFKPKWQNNNPDIRIAAIAELNSVTESNVLIDIISSDDNELVVRSALLKLNDFSQFQRQAREHSNKKLREFANKYLIDGLLGQNNLEISLTDKIHFIEQCEQLNLLENWLYQEKDNQLNMALITQISKRIGDKNAHVWQRIMLSDASEQVKLLTIEFIDDLSVLKKVAKRKHSNEVLQAINGKIDHFKELVNKPIELKKQSQLLLSKLLALKELKDYEVMVQRKNLLVEQWQQLVTEFGYLNSVERDEITVKYHNINEQINKHFTQQEEHYLAQQQANKVEQAQQEAEQNISFALKEIAQKISDSVFTDVMLDQAQTIEQLQELKTNVISSNFSEHKANTFLNQIEQLHHKLTQLPQIAESVAKATQLITRISTQALPTTIEQFNNALPIYELWFDEWRENAKSIDNVLPESLSSSFEQIKSSWQQAIAPLTKQQRQDFHYVQKKLQELKRLIASGKYKSALGLFNKVEVIYQQLSSKQKLKLARDYEFAVDKTNELTDWQAYIATPRKQEILAAVELIAETPEVDLHEQANQVKNYRKQWNSLGKAEQEVDEQLNVRFNELCEQAFSPCREFFKEQELEREANYQQRQAILTKLSQFLEQQQLTETNDIAELDNQLSKIKKQWQSCGKVEHSKYRELMSQYKSLVAPLQLKINEFYKSNALAKQKIIDKAEQLENESAIQKSVEIIKALQQEWKTIGFSGAKVDSKLWTQFRAINDKVFAQRDNMKAQQQQESLALSKELDSRIAELSEKLNSLQSLNDVYDFNYEVGQVKLQLKGNQQLTKQFSKVLDNLKIKSDHKKSEIAGREEKQKYQAIFAVLNELSEAEEPRFELLESNASFQALPQQWQKVVIQACEANLNDKLTQQLTIELEVLAGIDSPPEFKKERMAVQVDMLSEKLNQGSEPELDHKLSQWLISGGIKQAEKSQLDRIRAIFC